MKSTLQHEKFGTIVFEESFWTGKKNVSFNGVPLQKTGKNQFITADGTYVSLMGNYMKGAQLLIGGETIRLTPSVKWYEIVFSIIPFLLVLIWGNSVTLCNIVPVVGGAIGGLIGALFSVLNLFLIKGIKRIWLKAIVSLVSIAITFLVCFGVAEIILSFVS